jgi:hypothetical protein
VNERANIHDMPFADRFKGGKMYEAPDDLAALVNDDDAATGDDRKEVVEPAVETRKAAHTFTGDAEHILIHDINKAFANITKKHFDIIKLRIEAGKLLIEARKHVAEGMWEAWCKANITQRTQRDIRKVMKLAGADDPVAAAVTEREKVRNQVARSRAAEAPGIRMAGTPEARAKAEHIESPQETALKARVAELEDWIAALNVELQNERGHVTWLEEELELETLARKTHKSATPFTKAELRQLSMAFHPDANLSVEKRTELFKLWNSKVGL